MAPILYYSTVSSNARIPLLVARNLGIEIVIKEVNLAAGEQYQEWFLKINPQHAVPCLDDDGFILTESRAIAQYLVNSKAPDSPLYPLDPKKRAVVDQRLNFDLSKTSERIGKIVGVVKMNGTQLPDDIKDSVLEVFKWVNEYLSLNEYVAGNEITIADLAFIATLSSLIELGVKLDDYPEVQRWYKKCSAVPGWTENGTGAKAFAGWIQSQLGSVF